MCRCVCVCMEGRGDGYYTVFKKLYSLHMIYNILEIWLYSASYIRECISVNEDKNLETDLVKLIRCLPRFFQQTFQICLVRFSEVRWSRKWVTAKYILPNLTLVFVNFISISSNICYTCSVACYLSFAVWRKSNSVIVWKTSYKQKLRIWFLLIIQCLFVCLMT